MVNPWDQEDYVVGSDKGNGTDQVTSEGIF